MISSYMYNGSNEWLLREAAGNPDLLGLLHEREVAIQALADRDTDDTSHLESLVGQIVVTKENMGLDPLTHPMVDYGLLMVVASPRATDKQ